MKVEVLPEAMEDLRDGFHFYECQKVGLGWKFREALFEDIDALRDRGGIHSVINGFHRSLSSHFPYAIYYRIEGEGIQVYAVLDCRSDPMKHWERLG